MGGYRGRGEAPEGPISTSAPPASPGEKLICLLLRRRRQYCHRTQGEKKCLEVAENCLMAQ